MIEMSTLPSSQSEELDNMSKEEVWYDEERDEFVIELDGKNEYLNNLLREANEKAEKDNV